MTGNWHMLILLLYLASVEFSVAHLITQLGEPVGGREAVEKGIVYEKGYEVTTIMDSHKINVSVYSTHPIPGEDYLYALDMKGSEILKLRLPIGQSMHIAHFAGSNDGEAGHEDGWAKSSLFNHPRGLSVDDEKNIYVADVRNSVIRKITPEGMVSTIAGVSNVPGFADGEGRNALLSADFDITYISAMCSLLVSDRGNKRLRLIRLKRSEACGSSGKISVGVEGLFFVISGTFVLTTVAVLTFKNWRLTERLDRLQMLLRNSWLWRGRADGLDPSPNSGFPQLLPNGMRAPLQTTSLPAKLTEVLPDLIDLSVDPSLPGDTRQAPAITDYSQYNRGGSVSSKISEESLPNAQSAPAALISQSNEEVLNQIFRLQESDNAQSQLRVSGTI
ncbi:hypothetical protein R1flu_021279 [Riccia fluitans]|uniref:NHL repeat-containing protein n=1 Tax=Riccia fluitans TaxID=41844 RepID=A0ABD1ZQX2_9MARC